MTFDAKYVLGLPYVEVSDVEMSSWEWVSCCDERITSSKTFPSVSFSLSVCLSV